ncbi:MAG: MBL fold metallo-hydrolase [Candidatus Melainabacteria bacterium]
MTETTTETALKVIVFPVGPLQCNCTIIGDPVSGKAVVIDPGGDPDEILLVLHENQWTATRILHTHAHFDHFLASGLIREATGAPLALHAADRYLWDHLEEQCARFAIPFTPVPPPDEKLQHEEPIEIHGVCGHCIHTPGHTPGSISFHFESLKLLVAGDTLFKNAIGRTDLWGGDYQQIERSIKKRLYTLDEETAVITGHGPPTSIAHEMRHNPYVKA